MKKEEERQSHYEAYIRAFPFSVEREYVRTSYGKTHVLLAGPPEGKPLFICQGGNTINPMTLSLFAPLARTYRIYAPDTIGHPGFSEENRLSTKDDSFAKWTLELMDYFQISRCAMIGPSYGGGIILRLAVYDSRRINCAVLLAPAGIAYGSFYDMIKDIFLPFTLFHATSSDQYLTQITSALSNNKMKKQDVEIIKDIFRYTKLEKNMPKLTTKAEPQNYQSPTLIIVGQDDVFFPANRLKKRANHIIPNLIDFKSYQMGHYPSADDLIKINEDIQDFLQNYHM